MFFSILYGCRYRSRFYYNIMMDKLKILAKRNSKKIWVFWNPQQANSVIRIGKAFHNLKYFPDRTTASDPCQPDVACCTGLTPECWYQSDIKRAYLTSRCRCKNEKSIRHRMVDIVPATELDSRTAFNWYQSDIGSYIGPTSVCRYPI